MNETDNKRIPQAEKRREARLGEVLEQAETVARGVLEPVSEASAAEGVKARQIDALRQWARDNGLWIDNADTLGILEEAGRENEVRLAADSNVVYKLNNLGCYGSDLGQFFARIEAQNLYFPDCAYSLTGFADNSDGTFCAVLSQPYIIAAREATEAEIREEMFHYGFMAHNEGRRYSNGEHDIYCAWPENVLVGVDGNLYFVGVVIFHCGESHITFDKKLQDNEQFAKKIEASNGSAFERPTVTETRPKELECDVVRFQNNKEKWVAFVGLLNGRPYEIFTGLQDDDEGIVLPKTVTKGKIIKQTNDDGSHRYDFQFENKRGYKTTVEGLSEKFNPEYWNYAKLISGVLRYNMPIDHVMKLVSSLQLNDESINTWKTGVERALKKYVADGTLAKGQICPVCGHESLVYQKGSLVCTNCGATRSA